MKIRIYPREDGAPHFHTVAGGAVAVVTIRELEVVRNSLSPATLHKVLAWAAANRTMLLGGWSAITGGL